MTTDPKPSYPNPELSELLNLGFAADVEAVGSVADTIDATLLKLQVPEQRRLEIGLAVQEALVNAVVHGCKNDPGKKVHCRMQADGNGRILIIVSDPGPGFHPDRVADPKQVDRVLDDHGRGVYLIRQLMDEVHFDNNGSQIRMWKY
jgi:serine/threonine-protein kinase RsbW